MGDVALQCDRRPRLLIAAYHYDRAYSMESRLSWQRAQQAAAEYEVTVIAARPEIDARRLPAGRAVRVILLPLNPLERALMGVAGGFYLGYRLWHRRVLRLAKRLHDERPFDLVHQVSFCGYREPSDLWKLGVPFVWGPIGGTQSFPLRFLGQLSPGAALREFARNVVNEIQLRWDLRVQCAARSAAYMLAANRQVAGDLARATGVSPLVQLETGVDVPAARNIQSGNGQGPLRILWAGRLQPWKGLPLLLKALAKLPSDARYELRVLGEGPCERRWRRLARRLGVDASIQWCGWPNYAGQRPHYQWANLFAFTSLRDTSGTGLLEALAAGTPIIGLNHQGAADIMTGECAVAVDASSPARAIDGFHDAIAGLIAHRDQLSALSAGAIERAYEYSWERQWELMRAVYRRAGHIEPVAPRNPTNDEPESSPWPANCLVEAC